MYKFEQKGLIISANQSLTEFFEIIKFGSGARSDYCHRENNGVILCYKPHIDEDSRKTCASAKSSELEVGIHYYTFEFELDEEKLKLIWPMCTPVNCVFSFSDTISERLPSVASTWIGEKCGGVYNDLETRKCFMGDEFLCGYSTENQYYKNRVNVSEGLAVSFLDCPTAKSYVLYGMVAEVTILRPNTHVSLQTTIDSSVKVEAYIGFPFVFNFASTKEFASSSAYDHGINFLCQNANNVPCNVRIRVYFFGEKSPWAAVA